MKTEQHTSPNSLPRPQSRTERPLKQEMSAGTSTTHAQDTAALQELVQTHYLDAHRISVALSATGKGHHLRWHYSENLAVKPEAEQDVLSQREASPALSYASTHLVDDDGDSVMGDDEERPCTPPRFGDFDPGSVVLTPKKDGWRALRRTQRIGGGFDWWHDRIDVEERITFVRDKSIPPEDLQQHLQQPVDRAQLGPDALHLLEMLEAERERHNRSAPRSYSPTYKASSPNYDDDARSVVSSAASDATVIVDPRKSPQPTLFNGEMPLIRHPTLPADYQWNGRVPSKPSGAVVPEPQGDRTGSDANGRDRLSTIQEERSMSGSSSQVWPPRVPQPTHMRIFQNDAGEWVREGSLGPDVMYSVQKDLIPARVDADNMDAPGAGSLSSGAGPSSSHTGASSSQAGPSTAAARMYRTDTQVFVEIPIRRRRVQPEPVTTLRRSARLRK